MKDDKIENNPSYQKLKKEMEGAEFVHKIAKLFSFFGFKNKELDSAFSSLPEMKKQLKIISQSPDKFNNHFARKGWIAHESMNSDLMLESIELAEKGQIEVAEQKLIDHYTSKEIKWLIHQLKSIQAFSIRYKFFLLAYEDTIAERYYAVVPILLIMIDGAVNDIDKGKGFFADKINLTAWDSIAAHSSGLTVLKEIFGNNRKKTTTDEITLPYRHGILHGRDLGYANKTLTSKCWAALFAIKDWAEAVKQGKKNPPPPKTKLTFRENLSELKKAIDDYSESQKRNKETNKKIEKWKPRHIQLDKDIPSKGVLSDYPESTPERAAVQFIEYWMKNNFGGIAKQMHRYSRNEPINTNKEAGKVRNVFSGKTLLDYHITKIKDCSPAITEVSVYLKIQVDKQVHEKNVTMRLIYEDENGNILIIGDKGGQWQFIETFFHQIEYLF